MNTFARSYEILSASKKVVKTSPALIYFPLVSLIISVFVAATVVVPIGYLSFVGKINLEKSWIAWLCFLIYVLAVQFVTVFTNSAFFLAADSALNGEKVNIRKSFKQIWALRKLVAMWALVSGLVSFAVQYAEQKFETVGKWVASIFGIAWSLATVFAVPVLVKHKTGPVQTIKDSAQIFKKAWGESVVASFALGGVTFLGILLITGASAMILVPLSLIPHLPVAINVTVGILALISIFWVILYFSALEIIFKAALFRYADTGDFIGPFSPEMIKEAYQPKPQKKKLFSRALKTA